MQGLIKKDLLMIKSNTKQITMIFILILFLSLNDINSISAFPVMITIITFLSTFSYDEYNKWNAYAITFPTARIKIVQSKYIATIILTLLVIILTTIIQFVISIFNSIIIQDLFLSQIAIGLSTIIIISIMYPLIFKYGIEKGRLTLFIVIFILVGGIELFITNINISKTTLLFIENYLILILFVIATISILISYNISKRVFLKKEF